MRLTYEHWKFASSFTYTLSFFMSVLYFVNIYYHVWWFYDGSFNGFFILHIFIVTIFTICMVKMKREKKKLDQNPTIKHQVICNECKRYLGVVDLTKLDRLTAKAVIQLKPICDDCMTKGEKNKISM